VRMLADRIFKAVLFAAAGVAALVVLLIAVFVLMETVPLFRSVSPLRFVTDDLWNPTNGRFGMVPMIAGTLAVSAGAAFVAVPLGVISGLFCVLYAPAPVAKVYRTILELLAAVPSVVFGLWGLVVIVPIINRIEPPNHRARACLPASSSCP
jgi:phosphate transport system permease protein